MTAKKKKSAKSETGTATKERAPSARRPTLKQSRFVENYLANGGNATQAAKDAGYAPISAHVAGHWTLRNSVVKERIEARLADADIDTREILGTLASQMRADIADIIPDNPIAKAAKDAGVSHLIKKVTIKRYWDKGKEAEVEETTIEIHNSQAAAKILGKYRGLEKLPDENPLAVERQREKYERAVRAFIEAKTRRGQECTRESAIAALSTIEPEISKYVN